MPPSSHITPSGGLFSHHFIEAIQQASFAHPAVAPEMFLVVGQKSLAPAELERGIASAWELLTERWDSLGRELPSLEISPLRERWIRPLMTLLDFELEYQRADLVLEDDLRFPISYLGKPVTAIGGEIPVHTVLASVDLDTKADPSTRSGGRGGAKSLAPHDMLQRYLNLNRAQRWGLLTNGLKLRLLRDYHHSSQRGFVEFDLAGMFDERDFAAFRALYRMCHVSRFQVSGGQETGKQETSKQVSSTQGAGEATTPYSPLSIPLELFYQHSQATGVKVGEDLRENVRAAIEILGNGFLHGTPGLLDRLVSDETVRYPELGELPPVQGFFHDVLTVIYRVLFLLFAEQRGMLPGRGSLYAEEFSLTALRTRAERPLGEDAHFDLWERLQTTFRMVGQGAPELGIFGYNGALFGAERTPILNGRQAPAESESARGVQNQALLAAIRSLTTVERERTLQRVSYLDLSVEEIGSIYESLLDFTPRISTQPETVDGREVAAQTFFLDPRGTARKTTGSYYTHPSLVNQLIGSALLPVLSERLQAAAPSFDPDQPESLRADERERAEQALLSLRVLDPSAGSGAFLIAAMNTLGLNLARIRQGDLYPPEGEVRRARREVLAHCIYGVDLNPMAVELCKVSLWIDAAVPDAPLNFLDHHIKPGNSLVGATRALLEAGIPDEAYSAVSGDDKTLANSIRKENRETRESGQMGLWQVNEAPPVYQASGWQALNELAEADPHAAEKQYLDLLESDAYQRRKLAADIWTAAFFWKLTPGGTRPPTTATMRQAQSNPQTLPLPLLAETRALAERYRFFHWEIEFEDVFTQNGGFDVILGNPPWERIKLQEKEFFAVRDRSIADASNPNLRQTAIAHLQQSNPGLWNEYEMALHSAESTSKFLRGSERYPLTGIGDVNTYSIFSELTLTLLSSIGRAGIIVPSGIASDFTNRDFFANIIAKEQLASLYDFENRQKLFSEVDSRMKFSLMTLKGAGSKGIAEFGFFLLTLDDLKDERRRFNLTSDDFAKINPNTLTCPVFRTRQDADLVRKIYSTTPVLVNESKGENPWGVEVYRLLDMNNNVGLLRSAEKLESEGYSQTSDFNFRKGNKLFLRIYEGKMIDFFNHRLATGYTVETGQRTGRAELSTDEQLQSPDYTVNSRFWVDESEVKHRMSDWPYNWFLSYMNICSPTNVRTMIPTIIPYSAPTYSLRIVRKTSQPAIKIAALFANLASIPFDYVVRQVVAGVNLSEYIVNQLPVLSPDAYSAADIAYIAPRVLELVYTAHDLRPFAEDMGYTGEPFRWDAERRAQLRAELDAWYARLYGLTRDELRYILDPKEVHGEAFPGETFRVLKDKEMKAFGEFRTRRLVLEAWDGLVGGAR